MNNVEALKSLYIALGGEASDVADANTSVEVLNAIAAKYEGADDATLNPEGILNVAAIVDKIGTTPTGTKSITENGTHDVAAYASAEVNVAGIEWRNFTLTIEQSGEEWQDAGYVCFPFYNDGDQLEIITDSTNDWLDVEYKLPVINGKCEMKIMWNITQITLQEGSKGCSLTEDGDGSCTLTISEDNAIVLLFATQIV